MKHVIAIMSGKGGVGKSLVTSLLAKEAASKGYRVGILDADITGPSIPKAFGLHEKIMGNDDGMFPAKSSGGISVISINLMLEDETAPAVWRGPIIASAVKQFWSEVAWGDLDYLFVDMPPGTGDVPLTVFQSLPVEGAIIVTTPQSLVEMIVEKAIHMTQMMNVPVKSIVQNMSYVECPDCGKRIHPFGEGKIEELAKSFGIQTFDELPLDPTLTEMVDSGTIELYSYPLLDNTLKALE